MDPWAYGGIFDDKSDAGRLPLIDGHPAWDGRGAARGGNQLVFPLPGAPVSGAFCTPATSLKGSAFWGFIGGTVNAFQDNKSCFIALGGVWLGATSEQHELGLALCLTLIPSLL